MVTGSLQERNGKYTAVLNLYENGRRKQKSIALGIPVKGNKRKALEMLEELKRLHSGERIKDLQIKKDSPLLADFLKDWLKITAPTIERTTYQSYESMINARLDSFFRMLGVTLAQVEPSHIRALHDSIFKDGCNANTVIHYHAIVRKALQYAVKNEMISKNPADMVDRPKMGSMLRSITMKTSWRHSSKRHRGIPWLWSSSLPPITACGAARCWVFAGVPLIFSEAPSP